MLSARSGGTFPVPAQALGSCLGTSLVLTVTNRRVGGLKRISESNGRNQESKIGNQGGRCRKTAGQNRTARIRKQRRRNQKTEQNRKAIIRKQPKQNQKTGQLETRNPNYLRFLFFAFASCWFCSLLVAFCFRLLLCAPLLSPADLSST